MDDDIAEMAKRLEAAPANANQAAKVHAAIQEALGHPQRKAIACTHAVPPRFVRGNNLGIELETKQPVSVRLFYRHVNQAEHYQDVEMQSQGGEYRAIIPGSYTDSIYPLQYYFELKQEGKGAWLYPGLNPDLTNQPYFIVRSV